MSASSDRAPGDLARRIGHAMRSSLGVLHTAHAELPGADPALRDRMLALAQRATDQLEHMALRLSVLGRLEYGSAPEVGEAEIADLVERAKQQVVRRRPRRGIEVGVRVDDPHLAISIDRALVELAFVELLDNAVRAARRRVELRVTCDDGGLRVIVRDDGPGIDTSTFDRARSRTVPLDDRSGLAIGVWLADSVARLHDGSLSLQPENAPSGGGSAVELSIPRA